MRKAKNTKLTYDQVKGLIENNSFLLISPIYVNSKEKLHMKCPKEHDCFITYDAFRNGNRCSDCSRKKKKTIKEVKDFFASKGYQLISTEYKNSKTLLNCICPSGHKCALRWNDIHQGHGCSDCKGLKKKNLKQVKSFFEKEGYQLVSKRYVNSSSNLHFLCPKKHDCFNTYGNFQQGQRCGICANNGTSRPEQELMTILKEYFPDLIKKTFKVNIPKKPHMKGFQVDILNPKDRLGIEFDGTHYHSEEFLIKSKTEIGWTEEEARNYHKIKDDVLFNSYGIKLLHIKEQDWNKDKQSCVKKCLEFLGA